MHDTNSKIIIYIDDKDPNMVRARDIMTGLTSCARCHPNDEFDFDTGAFLALHQLHLEKIKVIREKLIDNLKKIAKTPIAKTPWTGKIVCIDCGSLNTHYTKGKVYEVKMKRGHQIISNNYNTSWPIEPVYSVEDINKYFKNLSVCPGPQFIEFKEGDDKPKKQPWTGKVVCISTDFSGKGSFFTIGKVYEVDMYNGRHCLTDNKSLRRYIDNDEPICSVDELNLYCKDGRISFFHPQFIEFKGE